MKAKPSFKLDICITSNCFEAQNKLRSQLDVKYLPLDKISAGSFPTILGGKGIAPKVRSNVKAIRFNLIQSM